MLETILQDPLTTPDTIEAIIRQGPPIPPHPVGLQSGMPVRVGERTYHYGLYVPPSYQPDQAYPLVLCLHGAGFTGDAYLERWQPRLGEAYILACPTMLSGAWWTREAEHLVLATLEDVRGRYRIDPDRIFLTGMSNGGIGVYVIGMFHADRFAGLAPMAGGLDNVLLPFLENLRNTPAYLIHGNRDEVMPVELSRTIAKELERLEYRFIYREHDRTHPMAGGHFFPREELPALVQWFGEQRRIAFPRRLTVVRDASHLLPFAWARIDATDQVASFSDLLADKKDEAIAKRIYARLDAEIDAPNHIVVRTQHVRRYTLFLNRQLVDLSVPVTVVTDGSVSFEGPMAPDVRSLLRDARRRRDPVLTFPAAVTVPVTGPAAMPRP